LAELVGEQGQVFATEIKSKLLKEMRDAVTEAGLKNVSVVWGSQYDTGLPSRCCDAIVLRWVYHHFTEPEAMRTSLFRALRPGGLIMIIDFDPSSRDWWKHPDGVPGDRGGHGIPKRLLIEEMTRAGFEVAREIDPWHGSNYCVIFRIRPPVGMESL
jgi:SAM-dependent methyltransferase